MQTLHGHPFHELIVQSPAYLTGRVAEHLGVGAMSLYTHVPGKGELTDLMCDNVAGELYADVDEPARQQGGWRAAVRFIARRNWQLYEHYPWLLHLSHARPVMVPHVTRNDEAELRPLDGIGLTDVEMDDTLTRVLSHVGSVARARLLQHSAQQHSGQTDLEWWVAMAPLLEAVMSGQHFPVAARVGQAAGMAHQAVSQPRACAVVRAGPHSGRRRGVDLASASREHSVGHQEHTDATDR
ncbi:MAG: TetR/AcrR family transcriptional regulator C-terminal domain-containing protein [Thermomicrobiales bacterium]